MDGRVRINRNGVQIVNGRHTTRNSLCNRNTIFIRGHFAVQSTDNLRKGSLGSILNLDTIAVPCENFASRNTTFHNGGQVDLIAVTNSTTLWHIDLGNRSNLRFRNHFNVNRVRSGYTTGRGLFNNNMIMMNTQCRSNSVIQRSSISNRGSTIIPLISEFSGIPIINCSSKHNRALFTNHCIRSSDIHDGSRIHINSSNTLSGTTIVVHNLDAEVVRILAVLLMQRNNIRVCNKELGVVFHPSELNARRNRINISNKRDVITNVSTNDRISNQLNVRIRIHRDGIKIGKFRLTTRITLVHDDRVDISGRIAIHREGSIHKQITTDILNKFTVAIPSVNSLTTNTARSMSIESNASAFAYRLGTVKIVRNRYLRNVANTYLERVHSITHLIGIVHHVSDNNIIPSLFCRIESLNLMCSTRNQMTRFILVFIPFVCQQRIMVVIQISMQSHTTIGTN